MKKYLINALVLIFGVNYKVRASALLTALVTSTVDYLMTGGKPTWALLAAVWLAAAKSFFTKSVGVSNSPNPTAVAQSVTTN